ncbi:heterocyst frequency control protein PatD [Pleurocapsales cyanobacterium LEGE 06147]|nr:heterocyst frequency control protein PatD [Pleurocapsales cyanobacterium LEGE 06147]
MLPTSHNQAYQEFLSLLQQLQRGCIHANEINLASLQQQFQTMQTYFEQRIVPLTNEELDESIAPRWQSLQTELRRELRLLTTDMIFLGSSRQPETKEARLSSIRDRLEKINGYCQVMIA